jgi:hypothetical protein
MLQCGPSKKIYQIMNKENPFLQGGDEFVLSRKISHSPTQVWYNKAWLSSVIIIAYDRAKKPSAGCFSKVIIVVISGTA